MKKFRAGMRLILGAVVVASMSVMPSHAAAVFSVKSVSAVPESLTLFILGSGLVALYIYGGFQQKK